MAEKGYLRKGGHITIAGGEPCTAPEFDDLMQLFIDYDLSSIRVLTNATKYSSVVEKGIKEGRVNIVVSVDSGTRETFIKDLVLVLKNIHLKEYPAYDWCGEIKEKVLSYFKQTEDLFTEEEKGIIYCCTNERLL